MEIDILGFHLDLTKFINPIFYIAFVLLLYVIVRRVLKTLFLRATRGRRMGEREKQRVKTIHGMLNSVIGYVTLIMVFLIVLSALGVDIGSLIAGLGILTAVLGLAFQDMIKDIIAGVAIVAEGQFSVGDTVEINGFKGVVMSVGLKTTQIRNYRNEIKVISNRNIDNLVNYSKLETVTEVTLAVPYATETAKVTAALSRVKKGLDGKIMEATGEIVISPVSGFNDSGAVYTLSCACLPTDAADVQAAIRGAVLSEFKKDGVEVSYPHVVVGK